MDSILIHRLAAAARGGLVLSSLLVVIGCQTAVPLREQSPATIGGGAAGATYVLDAASSELHVLVYRAGPFARLGHNHVVAARDLEGRISLLPAADQSTFELLLAVDKLDVDPAPLRERYGEAFSSTPSDADIAGTRANMLGEALLNAAAYPYVRIAGRLVRRDGADVADIEVAVKDTVARLSVSVALEVTSERIEASGAFQLDHAAIGLTAFSVFLGALRVAETMDVRFSLVALREGPS